MNTLTAKQHRANARAYLGGNIFHKNWLTALLISLVGGAIVGAASMVTGGVGSIILTGPMTYGMIACFFLSQERANPSLRPFLTASSRISYRRF